MRSKIWTDGRGNYSPVETLTCNQRAGRGLNREPVPADAPSSGVSDALGWARHLSKAERAYAKTRTYGNSYAARILPSLLDDLDVADKLIAALYAALEAIVLGELKPMLPGEAAMVERMERGRIRIENARAALLMARGEKP